MTDEFYAIIKLVTGEEIFGIVSPTKENGIDYLLVYNPIKILPLMFSEETFYYKVEPWMKLTDETLFVIEKTKIITVVESSNKEFITLYKRFINTKDTKTLGNYKLSNEEGYINNVKDVRGILEKIYKS